MREDGRGTRIIENDVDFIPVAVLLVIILVHVVASRYNNLINPFRCASDRPCHRGGVTAIVDTEGNECIHGI